MRHRASKIIIVVVVIMFIFSCSPMRAETPAPALPTENAVIHINELLPNPIGNDNAEWIELKNQQPFDVALRGWKLASKNSGNKPYVFSREVIPTNGLLIIMRTQSKLIFNNNSDTVRIIDPQDVVQESVHYENAPEGKSFAKIGSDWHWVTSSTPWKENENTLQTLHTNQSPPPPDETEKIIQTDIKNAKNLNDDTPLIIHGIVTAPLGIFGKKTFSMQDATGTYGMFVRISTGLLPTLQPGDNISLQGRLKKREEKIWIASKANEIHFLSHSELHYNKRAATEINKNDAGIAVLANGTISSHGSHWITLADNRLHREIRVVLPNNFSTKIITDGNHATLKGVIHFQKDGPEILVMDKKDITLQTVEQKNTAKDGSQQPKPTENQNNPTSRQPLSSMNQDHQTLFTLLFTLLTAGALIVGYFIWKKKKEREIIESDL